ncbi:MAG TPA: ATP-binding protein [Archaeoglobus profundus]|nr:ATP-binding protein [Archaeoglobus profundus]HIP58543.1 ATP-binding protein [Archaeoglobus profundus]
MTIIAVTGKGGTGKTAIAALLVKYISENTLNVLAVDADPDSNLPDALGVEVTKTLGEIKEIFQVTKDGLRDKELWLEGKIFEVIHEFDRFDLLVMGRPEGEGCYCFVNNLLRVILRKFMSHYDYVIVDCEAGLEHFSRKTIDSADYIIVVTDTSKKGLKTAKRIKELVKSLSLNFKEMFLIGNKIKDENAKKIIKDFAKKEGFILLDLLPYDEKIVELDLNGEPIVKLPENSEYAKKVRMIAEMLMRWSS